MDRFGKAIEWDLRELLKVELLDFFRGLRPWTQLRRYLDQLQEIRTSRFVIAQQNDPELAMTAARRRREAAKSTTGGRWRPPAVDFDTAVEIQARILDRLGEVATLLEAMPVATDKHGKPRKRSKPPKPFPRPETAVEQAEQLLTQEHVSDIITDVESSYVSPEEYERIAAEVEAARQAGTALV